MTSDKEMNSYADGTTELKDILGVTPDYLEQLKGRAQFFIEGGHHERAVMMLEMLEQLDRTDPMVTLLAIDSLLAQGRSDAAEAKARGLLARDPDNADALVALAEVRIAVGDMVSAAATLGRVIDADPDGATDAGRRAVAVAAAAHARLASV